MDERVVLISFELCGINTIIIRSDGMINASDAIKKSTMKKQNYNEYNWLSMLHSSGALDRISKKYNVVVDKLYNITNSGLYLNVILFPVFLSYLTINAEKELKNHTIVSLSDMILQNIVYIRDNAVIAKVIY
jgi:hypothetical protein